MDGQRVRIETDDLVEVINALNEHGVIDLVTGGRLYRGFRLEVVQLKGKDGKPTGQPGLQPTWDVQGTEEDEGPPPPWDVPHHGEDH